MQTKTAHLLPEPLFPAIIFFAALAISLTVMSSQALALNMDVRPENSTVLYE
jgi:hypothetical protein